MKPTVCEQSFEIPSTEVFAVLIDPTTFPDWLVGTKRIREVSTDWPEPGSYFTHTVGFGPLKIPDRTTLRDVESPRLLVLYVRARPLIEAVVRFDVIANGLNCILQMSETPAGGYKIVAPLARPLIKARNERSLRRLKQVIDSVHR
jgi:uncharacterized protein YndB with AHSA1/START domain